jgi:hypothetical protein
MGARVLSAEDKEGVWMHVGTPDAVTAAEAAIVDSAVSCKNF